MYSINHIGDDVMKLLQEARKFIINQRLKELRQSNQHWPNSKNYDDRVNQIDNLEAELKRIDEEK